MWFSQDRRTFRILHAAEWDWRALGALLYAENSTNCVGGIQEDTI